MRHILRFDHNKYLPMAKGVTAQGHIPESSCWCHPYIMLPIRDGVPVYVHLGLAVTKRQACARVIGERGEFSQCCKVDARETFVRRSRQ